MSEPEYRVRPQTVYTVTGYSRRKGSDQAASGLGVTQANEIAQALAAKSGGSFAAIGRDEARWPAATIPDQYRPIAGMLAGRSSGAQITFAMDGDVLIMESLFPTPLEAASVSGAAVTEIVRRELAARDAERDPMAYLPGPVSTLLEEAASKPFTRADFRALVGEFQIAVEQYFPDASASVLEAFAVRLAQGDRSPDNGRSPAAVLEWIKGKDDPRQPVEPLNVVHEAAAWALASGRKAPVPIDQMVSFNHAWQARSAYLKRLINNPSLRNDLFLRICTRLYPDTPVDVARDWFMEAAALHPNKDERLVWGQHLARESGQPFHEIMQWISTFEDGMVRVAAGQPLDDPKRETFAIRLAWGDTMNTASSRAFGSRHPDTGKAMTVGDTTAISQEPLVASRVLMLRRGPGSDPIPYQGIEQYARSRALGFSHSDSREKSASKVQIPVTAAAFDDAVGEMIETRIAFLKTLPPEPSPSPNDYVKADAPKAERSRVITGLINTLNDESTGKEIKVTIAQIKGLTAGFTQNEITGFAQRIASGTAWTVQKTLDEFERTDPGPGGSPPGLKA